MLSSIKTLSKATLVVIILCFCGGDLECRASFNSAQEYVDNVPWGGSYAAHWKMCLSPNYIFNPIDLIFFYNIYLPDKLPDTSGQSASIRAAGDILASMMVGFAYTSYQVFTSPAYLLGLMTFMLWPLFDVCTNTFIMLPHEYINYKRGWVKMQGTNNVHPCAITRDDVPYYFQCDDTTAYGYDGSLCQEKPGGHYDTSICNCQVPSNGDPAITPPTFCLAEPDLVGFIIVGYDGELMSHNSNGSSPFRPAKIMKFKPKDTNYRFNGTYYGSVLYSYYSQVPLLGYIQACVASPTTVPPVLVGCGPIAPPLSPPAVPLDSFYNDTRCVYLASSREDLKSLSNGLGFQDQAGHGGRSVKRFLSGGIHFASTTVGCVKDLLYKIVARDYSAYSLNRLETSLRTIVYSLLVLYVALVGIKIISSASSLGRGEYIMFLIKIALVSYFILPTTWVPSIRQNTYNNSTPSGNLPSYNNFFGTHIWGSRDTIFDSSSLSEPGLFNALLWGGDQIGSFFVEAVNSNDPIGMCRYQMGDGRQLFSERIIPGYTIITAGYQGVRVSVWDFVDCKLANYLNLGSCHYTIKGMAISWVIALLASFSFVSIAFMIVMCIYCAQIIRIFVKLIYISIISAFVITVLVILAPLFISFSLFSFTKPMFDVWMRKLLGYMIYPAMLFGVLCLVIASLDVVFNGGIFLKNDPNKSEIQQLQEACKNKNSLLCQSISYAGDPCSSSVGQFPANLTTEHNVSAGPFSMKTRGIKAEAMAAYWKLMIPMMFLSFILKTFLQSMIEIIESLSGVSGVAAALQKGTALGKLGQFSKSLASNMGKATYQKGVKKLKEKMGVSKEANEALKEMIDSDKGKDKDKKNMGPGMRRRR